MDCHGVEGEGENGCGDEEDDEVGKRGQFIFLLLNMDLID
jgi:hypothetical protein